MLDPTTEPYLPDQPGERRARLLGACEAKTPTKKQAMAANRKRFSNISSTATAPRRPPRRGTFFSNISSTAKSARSLSTDSRARSPSSKIYSGMSVSPRSGPEGTA
ncbi:hypothetical protein HBH52_074130 [Parastagonospora nodorum]|nr:hypothetical protein HBH52_074130 [Parastagonospora nodorum]